MIKLQDIAHQVLEDYPQSFDMNHFKSLKTFKDRVNYCDSVLGRLGSGSSRIVYRIDDEKVLKLAKNKKGLAQNGVEGDRFIQQSYDHIVSKVFDKEENNLWIEMEKAKRISPSRFKQLLGFDIDSLHKYLFAKGPTSRGNTDYWLQQIPPDELNNLDSPEEYAFANSLMGMMADMDMDVGDFGRISTYGEVTRDGKPMVVVIDFGLTKSVFDDYYKR